MKELSTQAKGEIGELIVAADLLSKGFEVYKPIGATKDFDLLVIKDGKIAKIQVKSRRKIRNGTLAVPFSTSNVKGRRYFDKRVVD